ncbi:hybrid non-ribosomal peptide synthetase/type I polyketide synthase [Pseudoalteromonas prydzensis]|uniref:hybrid non-ribosomal peptide synthetase/type I polyketide synthase n=1 Tax=Pseudoalteromonas prydzensis TaxID=182141 RepID=UPI0007E503D4|nr:hybrid non-ribosomal peptide synthetase/type I polyketide synthase [Pseudoalteromonas prydzensis]MBE0377184.1 hypothetical protein [Pseudoalteromonas prydzensis ACAM 620]
MTKKIEPNGLEVAVVGMSLRLPHCETVDEFWQALSQGSELIKFYNDDEMTRYGVSSEELGQKNYVKAGAFLDNPFQFDADFFNYVAREAEFMDPQLRLLHECSWQALQDAGCNPESTSDAIGLYCGSAQNMNWLRLVSQHLGESVGEVYELQMLFQREFFNTRMAYNMNLQGPAITIDSSCSTSLVAIHMAVQGLLSGDCDLALSGGVCISPLVKGYSYHEGMIQSPDGHCRAFDAGANGTVPGNGVGIVALKRLEDAIVDGNHIYAVLKGSAINNDGHAKPGYTAPSVKGQKRVIESAIEAAGVDVEQVDFIECHGTATKIGDPIEVEALNQAYGTQGDNCYIGSVKSNVGHLDSAAGVIGFIKAALALKHEVLPASLHYNSSNGNIDFSKTRLSVNTEQTTLNNEERPLRGAVSSFGIGGTNAHVILEEYVERRVYRYNERRWQLLPYSAKSKISADNYGHKLAKHFSTQLSSEQTSLLADTAYSMQNKDARFVHRRAVVANTLEKSHQAVSENLNGYFFSSPNDVADSKLVFMFPGQGGQYLRMAADLYEFERGFRALVNNCCALLNTELSQTLKSLLFSDDPMQSEQMMQTDNAQPLLFIIEYSLARYLMDLGIQPDYMLGHSLGEYVAACLAGVFTLKDALIIVAERGRLMARTSAGAMLSIAAPIETVEELLNDELELAACNSTELYVLSGSLKAVDHAIDVCQQRAIKCSRLHTSHAYHSYLMNDVLNEFANLFEGIELQAPVLPFYSNFSGELITAEQAVDPDYWVSHLRNPVNFVSSINNILEEQGLLFIEVGPGNSLSTFVRNNHNLKSNNLIVNSLRHPKEKIEDDLLFHQLLSRLYCKGIDIDWAVYNQHQQCRQVPLPAYSFTPKQFGQIAGNQETAMDSTAKVEKKVVRITHPRPELSTAMVAPRNEAEEVLSAFWRKLFTLDEVGVEDNFFELGGHSLLATRVLSFVLESFDVDMKINDIFEYSTIAGLVQRIETYDSQSMTNRIVRVSRDKPVLASFQQRRLWLIDQLDGGSAQYNMPAPFILRGELDMERLQQAVNHIVERHESLRTNFIDIEGESHLIVRPVAPVEFSFIDLSSLDETESQAQMQKLIDDDALAPFDLQNDLMLRASIVKINDKKHLLLFNIHHIVSDGWSEIIMVKELCELYSAYVEAREPQLPALPLQYIDFAAWQRNEFTGERLESELGYWQSQLKGIPSVHNIPLDRARPEMQTYSGEVFRRSINQEKMARLSGIAQQSGATLFMALQSVFALLLSRVSCSEDIIIGTPIAGRGDRNLESLIGFFVNTLVLRNDLSGNPDFKTLLARTKEMALSAFAHEHVPFDMLVERLDIERSPSYSPVFQVLFALQSYEQSTVMLADLEFEKVAHKVATKVDLMLMTAESSEGLLADWYFNTDLFDRETIDQMADKFELLIDAICDCATTSVMDISIFNQQEQARLKHQASIAYWKTQLLDAPAVHGLTLDHVRTSNHTYSGVCLTDKMNPEVAKAIEELAEAQDVSQFSIWHAALSLLLTRYSNNTDIVIGTPSSYADAKNLLSLRSNLNGIRTFSDYLAHIEEINAQAQEHNDVAFAHLVDALSLDASSNQHPVFQIMLSLDADLQHYSLDDLAYPLDINIQISISNEVVEITWLYNGKLFEQSSITRLSQHFTNLVSAIIANPEAELAALSMLDESEYQALHGNAQENPLEEIYDTSIQARFAKQVTKTPNNIAVIYKQEKVTYRELDQRANRLARYLLDVDVHAGDMVGMAMDRSINMIVTLLAILKTGAAYVPIDPEYPQSRIEHMRKDSGVKVLITQSVYWDAFVGENIKTLVMEELEETLSSYSCAPVEITESDGQALAYVNYTSGSTGKPKGVLVPHCGVIRLVTEQNFLPMDESTRFLIFSSISFDVITIEIWGPLLNGGSAVAYPEAYMDFDILNKVIVEDSVTTMWLTSGLFNQWSESLHEFPSLKYILAGGDVVNPAAVQRVQEQLDQVVVINGYGPTENTTFSTCYAIPRERNPKDDVSIGFDINGSQSFVVAPDGSLAPWGSDGELLVSGAGVALGYLNSPELTAEKFVHLPFTSKRLYRTGDLVRYREDGALDYIGRSDNQVKIRGFRVELGEVEQQLNQLAQVKFSVVTIHKAESGHKSVLAYVQLTERELNVDANISGDELKQQIRADLAEKLPEYMIPSAFFIVDDWPMSPNGKIDRKRLLESTSQQSVITSVQSLTELQADIRNIWVELLGETGFSIEDDFFRLGGDSILVLKLKSLLKRQGKNFPVPVFYRKPTIAMLAQIIEVNGSDERTQAMSEGKQVLLPAQHWFFGLDEQAIHHFNQAVILSSDQVIDSQLLRKVVMALVKRHDALRLAFVRNSDSQATEIQEHAGGAQWYGNYLALNDELIDSMLVVEDVSEPEELELRAAAIQSNLSLSGQLFKIALFFLPDNSCRLLLIGHHLIVDGVSWRILMSDLMTAYQQAVENKTIELAPKTTSMQQWGEALQSRSMSEEVLKEVPFWQKELHKTAQTIRHNSLGSNRVEYEKSVSVVFDPDLSSQLLVESQRAYHMGIEELLLAALSETIYRWQGQKNIRLTLESHGRDIAVDKLDVSDTVGWFTALYPLHLSHQNSIHEQLVSVKDKYCSVPMKGANFGLLRYMTDLLPDSHWPNSSDALVFNYLGQFDQSVNEDTIFAPGKEKTGALVSPQRQRDCLLSFDGMISGGTLRFSIRYSSQKFADEMIEALAGQFKQVVTDFVAHCTNTSDRHFTHADFPLVNLTDAELADLQKDTELIDIYPATPAQKGMVLHTAMAKKSRDVAYCNQLHLDLRGELDLQQFKFSWKQLVQENDIFRTAFVPLKNDGYVQALYANAELEFNYFGLENKNNSQQLIEYERYRENDRQRGFELSSPCLLRVSIWQMEPGCHRVLLTMHHAIIDGWSVPHVFKDVIQYYCDIVPSARKPFKAYIEWLHHQDKSKALAFWQNALGHVSNGCLLRADFGDSNEPEYAVENISVPAILTQKIIRFAKDNAVTMASLIQAAWAYLLHRYSGSNSVLFGTTIAGRPSDLQDADNMIGNFINTIPVSVTLDDKKKVGDWLKQIHTQHAEREQYGFVPLASLKQMTMLAKGEVMFNSIMVFENYPVASLAEEQPEGFSLSVENAQANEGTNFDLTLVVHPGEQIKLQMMYRADLYRHSRVCQLLSTVNLILDNMVDNANQMLGDIDLMVGNQEQESDELEQLLNGVSEEDLEMLMAEIS